MRIQPIYTTDEQSDAIYAIQMHVHVCVVDNKQIKGAFFSIKKLLLVRIAKAKGFHPLRNQVVVECDKGQIRKKPKLDHPYSWICHVFY